MNFPMNIEQWRLVSGYDNYEVSSHGRVRNNKTSRMMKRILNKEGYYCVWLSKDNMKTTFRVHRLVGFAFLEKKDEHSEVDHIDRNRSNNMLDNLRWATKSDNQRNASKRKDNTSGLAGVHYQKDKCKWVARWFVGTTGRKTKSFSVSKYGEDQAKQLAINYRKERAQENGYLNV